MRTPRAHCDLIKDWADGREIKVQLSSGAWIDAPCPAWDVSFKYRRKPVEIKATIVDDVLTLESGATLDLRRAANVFLNAAKSMRSVGLNLSSDACEGEAPGTHVIEAWRWYWPWWRPVGEDYETRMEAQYRVSDLNQGAGQ